MTEFNPNCGRCGMLNSYGFCSLTACRYPTNAIAVEPKVIRGMMVNPQIETPKTNADRIREMSDEELAQLFMDSYGYAPWCDADSESLCEMESCKPCCEKWLKAPVEVDNGT